eukprot:SAG11_NODE_16745_length_538_cov_10.703872_1_plen_146_part_01
MDGRFFFFEVQYYSTTGYVSGQLFESPCSGDRHTQFYYIPAVDFDARGQMEEAKHSKNEASTESDDEYTDAKDWRTQLAEAAPAGRAPVEAAAAADALAAACPLVETFRFLSGKKTSWRWAGRSARARCWPSPPRAGSIAVCARSG